MFYRCRLLHFIQLWMVLLLLRASHGRDSSLDLGAHVLVAGTCTGRSLDVHVVEADGDDEAHGERGGEKLISLHGLLLLRNPALELLFLLLRNLQLPRNLLLLLEARLSGDALRVLAHLRYDGPERSRGQSVVALALLGGARARAKNRGAARLIDLLDVFPNFLVGPRVGVVGDALLTHQLLDVLREVDPHGGLLHGLLLHGLLLLHHGLLVVVVRGGEQGGGGKGRRSRGGGV